MNRHGMIVVFLILVIAGMLGFISSTVAQEATPTAPVSVEVVVPDEIATRESLIEGWQLLVGFFLPLAIAAILRTDWQNPVKAITMMVVCLVATVGGMYLSGSLTTEDFNVANLGTTLMGVMVPTIASYYGIWRPLGATAAINSATN